MDSATPTAAVRVTCACGAQLRIRPEQVGKRVKCPTCGASVSAAAKPAPAPEPSQRRTRLEGLASDYRVRPLHWLALAWPHCRAVLGPSVGYLFLLWPILVVLLLLFWGSLGFLLSIKPSARTDTEAPLGLVLLAVGLAGNVIVLPALTIGFHLVCQAQLKGKRWRFATFFSGFRWTWPLAGRAALLLAAEVVLLLPGFAILAVSRLMWREPPAAVVGATAGLLLANFLVSGYIVVRLVFFSHWLIIDRGCGPIEALRGSWLLSRGHFWGLYGVLLLVVLLPLLGLGVVLALPLVILALNAGYLLVAGSEPLPGQQLEAERLAPRRRSLVTWLPAAAVAAGVLLFGVWVGSNEHAARVFRDERVARQRQQEETRRTYAAEEARLRKARASEEAEEWVTFFREGGCWSTELYRMEAAAPEASAPSGPGSPGRPGMGGDGGKEPPRRILVLGPRGLRQAKPTAPGPGWAEAMQRLESLRREERRLFYRRFAAALDKGEVEAVLVELARDSKGPAGAGGMGRGMPSLPGASGTGAPGGPAQAAQGKPVLLDKAVLLTRQRFLALVEDRSEQP